MDVNSYKAKILSRYFEHYQRVDSLSDANVLKTSEDIMMELRPIVDLQINEISEWMVESDYVLDVEGGGCGRVADEGSGNADVGRITSRLYEMAGIRKHLPIQPL